MITMALATRRGKCAWPTSRCISTAPGAAAHGAARDGGHIDSGAGVSGVGGGVYVPHVRKQVRTLWQFVLVLDEVWALPPFLLLHNINYGLALACTALLVYSPFAQRSLALMGAERAS